MRALSYFHLTPFWFDSSTKIGGKVEYHCFPGFERDGPFQRTCGEDGYWSGKEPKCNKPIPVVITRNDIDEVRKSLLSQISVLVNSIYPLIQNACTIIIFIYLQYYYTRVSYNNIENNSHLYELFMKEIFFLVRVNYTRVSWR